jgi:MerR family copper efflux transcriptional regulator
MKGMNISQAAEICGLPCKTIHYYEEIGLVIPKRQKGNDYRVYGDVDVARLCLLQQARAAGFGLDECRELLALHSRPRAYGSAELDTLIAPKLARIDQQLATLHKLRETLISLGEGAGLSREEGEVNSTASTGLVMAFTLVDETAES